MAHGISPPVMLRTRGTRALCPADLVDLANGVSIDRLPMDMGSGVADACMAAQRMQTDKGARNGYAKKLHINWAWDGTAWDPQA